MSTIQNLNAYDAFADTGEDNETGKVEGYIRMLLPCISNIPSDIRVQQRNGRKTLTTVQGLPNDLDQKRILKAFKKEFACNGHVVEDEVSGEVIQLQGDHRAKILGFLVENEITSRDKVKVHGF